MDTSSGGRTRPSRRYALPRPIVSTVGFLMMSSHSRKRAAGAAVAAESLESRVLLSEAPIVISSSLRPGAEGFTGSGNPQFIFHFDQVLRQPPNDAAVLTKLGAPPQSFAAQELIANHNRQGIITFPGPLGPGSYELRLRSGDGWFEALDGTDLDGEIM